VPGPRSDEVIGKGELGGVHPERQLCEEELVAAYVTHVAYEKYKTDVLDGTV